MLTEIQALEKPFLIQHVHNGKLLTCVDWMAFSTKDPAAFRTYIALRRGLRIAQ